VSEIIVPYSVANRELGNVGIDFNGEEDYVHSLAVVLITDDAHDTDKGYYALPKLCPEINGKRHSVEEI